MRAAIRIVVESQRLRASPLSGKRSPGISREWNEAASRNLRRDGKGTRNQSGRGRCGAAFFAIIKPRASKSDQSDNERSKIDDPIAIDIATTPDAKGSSRDIAITPDAKGSSPGEEVSSESSSSLAERMQ